jgi:hypothetical protein
MKIINGPHPPLCRYPTQIPIPAMLEFEKHLENNPNDSCLYTCSCHCLQEFPFDWEKEYKKGEIYDVEEVSYFLYHAYTLGDEIRELVDWLKEKNPSFYKTCVSSRIFEDAYLDRIDPYIRNDIPEI